LRAQNINGYTNSSVSQKSTTTGTQSQSFAQTLNRAIFGQSLLGTKYVNKNGAVTLEGMERELRELGSEFKKELNRHLRSAGLSRTEPFELEFASDGRIQVHGPHPDKEQIEQMFIDDPEFRNLAAQVCVLKDIIETGREASAFQQAYAADPVKAVAQYGHLFSGRQDSYTILCQRDLGWDITFKKATIYSRSR
jgi:hypothetical protein